MAKAKKYDYRIVQGDTDWSAEITRRASTESEAKKWGKQALESFLESLAERNKRRSSQREKRQQE